AARRRAARRCPPPRGARAGPAARSSTRRRTGRAGWSGGRARDALRPIGQGAPGSSRTARGRARGLESDGNPERVVADVDATRLALERQADELAQRLLTLGL